MKDVEMEEVNENDEEELDLEPLVDDGQDGEKGELLGEVDVDDSEEDDEDPNAPPPVHESLLRKGQKSSKPISKKAEDDEPREVKDKRTLFVGNLPIEAVRSRVSVMTSEGIDSLYNKSLTSYHFVILTSPPPKLSNVI